MFIGRRNEIEIVRNQLQQAKIPTHIAHRPLQQRLRPKMAVAQRGHARVEEIATEPVVQRAVMAAQLTTIAFSNLLLV